MTHLILLMPKKWNIHRNNFIIRLVTTYCHHIFNTFRHHSVWLTCDPNPITIQMKESFIFHRTCDGHFIDWSWNLWWIRRKKLLLSQPQWKNIPCSSNSSHKCTNTKVPSSMDCVHKFEKWYIVILVNRVYFFYLRDITLLW